MLNAIPAFSIAACVGRQKATQMYYLYGSKRNVPCRLVATFGSEQQLLAYVQWATLKDLGGGRGKFEQGSTLAGYDAWQQSPEPLTDEHADDVPHNPTPSML